MAGAPSGFVVTWGGVDISRGAFATVEMLADRYITVSMAPPTPTPEPTRTPFPWDIPTSNGSPLTASIPIPTATGVFQSNSGYILAPAELEQTIVGLLNNSNSESLLAAIASLTGDENISLVFDNESQQFRTAAAIPVPTATPTPLPPGFPTPTPTPTPIPTPTATPGSTIPPGTIFTLTTGANPSSGGTVSPSAPTPTLPVPR